jgi:hypothetical protein
MPTNGGVLGLLIVSILWQAACGAESSVNYCASEALRRLTFYTRADIEQPLTGGNVLLLTDVCPTQAKAFGRDRAPPFNAVMDLAFPGDADARHPFEPWAHPPHGRPLSRVGALGGDGLVLACPWWTQAPHVGTEARRTRVFSSAQSRHHG